MAKLKSFVILYGQLSGAGGAERVAIEEAKYFGSKAKTKLLTFKVNDEALFGNSRLKELELIRWKGDDRSSYNSFASSIRRVFALRARLKQLSPNIVIGCCWAGWIELYLASLFTSVPFVLHLHGSIFWLDKDPIKYAIIHKGVFEGIRNSVPGHKEFINPKPNLGLFERVRAELLAILDYLAVRHARRVFVLSHHMAWEVKSIYKNDAIVLPISPISDDMIDFTPTVDIKQELGLKGKRIVLSISRLDSRKRIDMLIKAFCKLSEDFPDLVLVIGGRGPDELRLKKLAKDLGIASKVIFVGFIDENNLLNYYSASDVFTYPGWGDYAITVYEALAQQKKVVCSSEMEIENSLLSSGYVFKAFPTVNSFYKGLRDAINSQPIGKINPKEYTWAKYFKKIQIFSEQITKH
jgi:glycosyltransferase involved in cell wall biosynthesis